MQGVRGCEQRAAPIGWSSLRQRDDAYWERVNHMDQGTAKVKAVTLDGLVARLGLSGPYLVKLDVQGAEVKVLGGLANCWRRLAW